MYKYKQMFSQLLIGLIAVVGFGSFSFASDFDIVEKDFSRLSASAYNTSVPILLIVSTTDCEFCARLKEDVIYPMLRNGSHRDKVIVRELISDQVVNIPDFDGTMVSPGKLADRYQIIVSPTMLFVDHNGLEIEERIIGLGNVEFAGFYIEKAIDRAHYLIQKSALLSKN